MKKRSQAVQRNLPRPMDVNHAVLRPPNLDTPLTELQKVYYKESKTILNVCLCVTLA